MEDLDREPAAESLLPVQLSEQEIVQVYRRLQGLERPLGILDAESIQFSPITLAMGCVDAALLLTLLFAAQSLPPFLLLILIVPAAFLVNAWISNTRRVEDGKSEPGIYLWWFGPATCSYIGSELRKWEEATWSPSLVVDTTSLDVIEPVAKHLADPLLRQADLVATTELSVSALVLAEKAEKRRDELRAQADRETDEAWRRAAEEQAARYDADRQMYLERHNARLAGREKILAESRSLRDHLQRLGDRRKLLREMNDRREEFPPAEDSGGAQEIGQRIAELRSHLKGQEALARDRIEAELEMNELERR